MRDDDLSLFVDSRSPDEIRHLFQTVSPNFTDRDGRNALFGNIANRKGLTSFLIARGADVRRRDKDGFTPLHFAAIHRASDDAEILLAHGADLAATDRHGNQPLWHAVFHHERRGELVALFMRHGADPNHAGAAGLSPLDHARRIGDPDLIALLSRS